MDSPHSPLWQPGSSLGQKSWLAHASVQLHVESGATVITAPKILELMSCSLPFQFSDLFFLR